MKGRVNMKKEWVRRCLLFAMMLIMLFSSAAVAAPNGLVEKSGKLYWYENGKMGKNEWRSSKGKYHYFGSTGAEKISRTRKLGALVKRVDSVIKVKARGVTNKKNKLSKLFDYMSEEQFLYARAAANMTGSVGWGRTAALQMLRQKKGSCYHFAAAYGFLAKRATGYPVRICWGQANVFDKTRFSAHAWVEIKIGGVWYTFDPNAARFSSRTDVKWFMVKSSSVANKVYKKAGRKSVNVVI